MKKFFKTRTKNKGLAAFATDVTSNDKVAVHNLTQMPTKAWENISVKQIYTRVTDRLDARVPVPPGHVRFVCISDTHTMIERMPADFVPDGDVLLHAGDFTLEGDPASVRQFNRYLGILPHKHKIVIAGNHDLMFDEEFNKEGRILQFGFNEKAYWTQLDYFKVKHVKELLTNCVYLEDESIDLYGIKIYGSPWQPEYKGWAFNVKRGQELLDIWNKIPTNTDILITHGPPVGYGDITKRGNNVGCVELLNTVQQRVQPKYHIFGHIHEGYGVYTDNSTTYINASTCTRRYHPNNPPVLFDFPLPEGHSKDEALQYFTKQQPDVFV